MVISGTHALLIEGLATQKKAGLTIYAVQDKG